MNQRLLGILLGFLSCAAPALAAEDAPSILREFIQRHQVPAEAEEMTVRLVDRLGHSKIRRLRRYSLQWEDGGSRHLLVVDAPRDVAGTALLAWQHPGQPSQYWSYLPAVGAVKPQGSKPGSSQSYFMGTDMTYEDLSTEDLGRYVYERMPDAKLDGRDVYVVRALPGNNEMAQASGYLHRDLYLDREDYSLRRIEYFDKRGKMLKRLVTVGQSSKVGRKGRRFNQWVIENVQARHRTEMHVERRELDVSRVSKHLFTPQYLAAGQHLRKR